MRPSPSPSSSFHAPSLGVHQSRPSQEEVMPRFTVAPYLEELSACLDRFRDGLFPEEGRSEWLSFLAPGQRDRLVGYANQLTRDLRASFATGISGFSSPSFVSADPSRKGRPRVFKASATPDASCFFAQEDVRFAIEELDFLDRLKAALLRFQKQITHLTQENVSMNTRILALQSGIDGLAERIARFPSRESGKRTTSDGAEVGRLEEERRSKVSEQSLLNGRMDENRKLLRSLRVRLRLFAQRAQVLFDTRSELNTLDQAAQELDETLQTLESQREALAGQDRKRLHSLLSQQRQLLEQVDRNARARERLGRRPGRFARDPQLADLLTEPGLSSSGGLLNELRAIVSRPQTHEVPVTYTLSRRLYDARIGIGFTLIGLGLGGLAYQHRRQIDGLMAADSGPESEDVRIMQAAIRQIFKLSQRRQSARQIEDPRLRETELEAIRQDFFQIIREYKFPMLRSFEHIDTPAARMKARLIRSPFLWERLISDHRFAILLGMNDPDEIRAAFYNALPYRAEDSPDDPTKVRLFADPAVIRMIQAFEEEAAVVFLKALHASSRVSLDSARIVSDFDVELSREAFCRLGALLLVNFLRAEDVGKPNTGRALAPDVNSLRSSYCPRAGYPEPTLVEDPILLPSR